MSDDRTMEFAIEIAAAPEEVWREISQGDGITRWFSPSADVVPGVGGKIMLSWGPGMEGEAPITIWEPGRQLGWEEQHGGPKPRVVTMTIEAREGGKTLLRLVHSGFGPDASFDAEYDSTNSGWSTFLALMRYDLEEHRGEPGLHLGRMLFLDRERGAVMASLLESISFRRDGNRFTASIPGLPDLAGRIIFDKPPGYLALAVDSLSGSALGLFAENCGGKTSLTTSWYLKGDAVERSGEIKQAWDALDIFSAS